MILVKLGELEEMANHSFPPPSSWPRRWSTAFFCSVKQRAGSSQVLIYINSFYCLLIHWCLETTLPAGFLLLLPMPVVLITSCLKADLITCLHSMSFLRASSLCEWRRNCLASHCSALLCQHIKIATCQTKVLLLLFSHI